jgi:hypothetical protein
MDVDFHDAANRHWEDAGHLLIDQRLANADQLFGIAAECALKAIMHALNIITLDANGKPREGECRIHINNLWKEFETLVQNRGGARYAAMLDKTMNPFDDWKVDQRYDHRSTFTEAKVENHRHAAERTMSVLQYAIMDGVIV